MDLSKELQNFSPSTPFACYGDGKLRALRLLQSIFQHALSHVLSKLQQPLDISTPAFQGLVQQKDTALAQ